MNSVQIHLALTHVPVILSLTGLIMLAVAFFKKNPTITRISYVILFIAGIAAIPVYFSGEGAEEAVEKLPGVSEAIIEKHEEIAKLAMITIIVSGIVAITALISLQKKLAGVLKIMVLILALTSGGLMAQTAHLGGQIRHSEIRDVAAMENVGDADQKEEEGKDDD